MLSTNNCVQDFHTDKDYIEEKLGCSMPMCWDAEACTGPSKPKITVGDFDGDGKCDSWCTTNENKYGSQLSGQNCAKDFPNGDISKVVKLGPRASNGDSTCGSLIPISKSDCQEFGQTYLERQSGTNNQAYRADNRPTRPYGCIYSTGRIYNTQKATKKEGYRVRWNDEKEYQGPNNGEWQALCMR